MRRKDGKQQEGEEKAQRAERRVRREKTESQQQIWVRSSRRRRGRRRGNSGRKTQDEVFFRRLEMFLSWRRTEEGRMRNFTASHPKTTLLSPPHASPRSTFGYQTPDWIWWILVKSIWYLTTLLHQGAGSEPVPTLEPDREELFFSQGKLAPDQLQHFASIRSYRDRGLTQFAIVGHDRASLEERYREKEMLSVL